MQTSGDCNQSVTSDFPPVAVESMRSFNVFPCSQASKSSAHMGDLRFCTWKTSARKRVHPPPRVFTVPTLTPNPSPRFSWRSGAHIQPVLQPPCAAPRDASEGAQRGNNQKQLTGAQWSQAQMSTREG